MGLALLIVPFLPAMNIFFKVGFVVAERVLFLSSAGYCLIVVLGLIALSRMLHIKKVNATLTKKRTGILRHRGMIDIKSALCLEFQR